MRRKLIPLLCLFVLIACKPAEDPAAKAASISAKIKQADAQVVSEGYAAAKALYESVLAEEPNNPEAIRGLGQCELMERNYTAAEQHLSKALTFDGKNPATHAALGQTYEMLKRHAEAAAAYQNAVALSPDRSVWILALGRNLRLANQAAKAEEVLRQLSVDDPKVEYVFSELGDALRAQKKLDEALGAYMKAQSTYGSDKAARAGAALVYEEKHEVTLAVNEWSEYLRMDCCSDYSNQVAKTHVKALREQEAGTAPEQAANP
jgi:tetratricopeptide (TPR) repeat protein